MKNHACPLFLFFCSSFHSENYFSQETSLIALQRVGQSGRRISMRSIRCRSSATTDCSIGTKKRRGTDLEYSTTKTIQFTSLSKGCCNRELVSFESIRIGTIYIRMVPMTDIYHRTTSDNHEHTHRPITVHREEKPTHVRTHTDTIEKRKE